MTIDVARVLERSRLQDLVEADVPLRAVGQELHGACPFCSCGSQERRHQCDRFRISRERTHWFCRQCSPRGGNAIDYAMQRYDLDFLRACVLISGEQPETEVRTPAPSPSATALAPDRPAPPLTRHALNPLQGSQAADYLAGRHIPVEVANLAGVGWRMLRPRGARASTPYVAFPFLDRQGQVVAYQYRAAAAAAEYAHHSEGVKSAGIFSAGTLEYAAVVGIVEAPIDALSLATAGVASVALGGIGSGPAWLGDIVRHRTVLLGHDHDQAGDEAAERLRGQLSCVAVRARPYAKDWNEDLAGGTEGVREHVRNLCQHLERCSVCGGPLSLSEQMAALGRHFDCSVFSSAAAMTGEVSEPRS